MNLCQSVPPPVVIVVLFIVGLTASVSGVAQAQPDQSQMFVQVLDQGGQPVPDLSAEEFVVEEDRLRTKVISAQFGTQPMKIALLVDIGEAVGIDIFALREGLAAFFDTLPPQHEIGLFTITGQVRLRVDFTTDRAELKKDSETIFVRRNAGNVFMDGLRETFRRRFDKEDFWPVFLVVVADRADVSRNMTRSQYGQFHQSLIDHAVSVHAVIVAGRIATVSPTLASITQNTGGLFTVLASITGLPETLTEYATKMGEHYDLMADRYRVVFERQSENQRAALRVSVNRPDVSVRLFLGRSMEQ